MLKKIYLLIYIFQLILQRIGIHHLILNNNDKHVLLLKIDNVLIDELNHE